MPTRPAPDRRPLRIALADEDHGALAQLAELLERMGHEVTAMAVTVAQAAIRLGASDPELAIVVLHEDDDHALELIGEAAETLDGPVVVLLPRPDAAFLERAAAQGISAFASTDDAQEIQGALTVAMRTHEDKQALADEIDTLRGALERRAVIERAKGILMERHGLGERAAFELLRGHARAESRRVVDVAAAVADGHALLRGDADRA